MLPCPVDRLADELSMASLQEASIGVAASGEESLGTIGNGTSQEATLLGIPQELRNKIFEYVYATPDMIGDNVGLTVTDPYICWPDDIPKAAVKTFQAPPSKNPLLACRQLYTEMGSMQAAAFRQYWSKSTFDFSQNLIREHPEDMLQPVAERNLKYVKHFIMRDACRFKGTVSVECHFQAGEWTASFSVSDLLWETICDLSGSRRRPAPQGRYQLGRFDREMRRQRFLREHASMDPDLGSGLTVDEIFSSVSIATSMILYGPSRGGWIAV